MNGVIDLRTDFSIDAGAIGNGVTARKCAHQPGLVAGPDSHERYVRQPEHFICPGTTVHPASEHNYIVALCGRGLAEAAADEARPPVMAMRTVNRLDVR